MSKEYYEFACENGMVSYLAGVLDGLLYNVPEPIESICSHKFNVRIEGDAFYLGKTDKIDIRTSIKNRMHIYADAWEYKELHKIIDELNIDLFPMGYSKDGTKQYLNKRMEFIDTFHRDMKCLYGTSDEEHRADLFTKDIVRVTEFIGRRLGEVKALYLVRANNIAFYEIYGDATDLIYVLEYDVCAVAFMITFIDNENIKI